MERPNVIFILIDDLGWAEPGCYGNDFNETPHIDALAASGIRFTNAYASATVCSPSRAGILTGQAPPRNGITDYLRPNSEWYLPINEGNEGDFADNELAENTEYKLNQKFPTMADMFKQNGYSTCIIGKWHLSGYDKDGVKYGPEKYGFDEVLLSEQRGIGGGSFFHPYTKVDPKIEPVLGENEYLVDRMNYEAVEYIKRHKDEPFFLYLSHYAVHTTLDAKDEEIEYFTRKRQRYSSKNKKSQEPLYYQARIHELFEKAREFLRVKRFWSKKKIPNRWARENNPVLAAMLKSIDDGVGKIVKILSDLELMENTLIVFTSDNGGESRVTQNGHLRGGKSFLYEGGLRVSQIISYPNLIVPNSSCNFPTINLDFYPTFAEILGYEFQKDHIIDGKSILPILKGKYETKIDNERSFFWHYPLRNPHFLGGRSSAANRNGIYKLIKFLDDGSTELYDLQEDESETTNLARVLPEKKDELFLALKMWLKEVKGKFPKNQKL